MKNALKKTGLASATLCALALTGATASAQTIIYSDDFTSLTTAVDIPNNWQTLNGSLVPSTSQAWSSAGYVSLVGNTYVSAITANRSAFLPFVPENDLVYTYTARLGHTGGSDTSWAGMSFNATATPDPGGNFVNNNGLGAVVLRQNGSIQWWAGPANTGNTVNPTLASLGITYNPNTFYDFQLVLDTRPTQWTLDLSVNNVAVDLNGSSSGTSHQFSTNPTIQWIQLTNSATTAIFDSVELSSIPEPSTYALLGLGLGAIVWLRRRNRRSE